MATSAMSFNHLQTLSSHLDDVTSVALSSTFLTSGSLDKTVRVYALMDLNEVKSFTDHTYQVRCVTFSPCGSYLASSAADGFGYVYNMSDFTKVAEFQHDSRADLRSCRFSPDSQVILSAGDDELLYAFRFCPAENACVKTHRFEGHEESVYCCAFTPDSKLALSASSSGDIRVWSFATSKLEVADLNAHDLGTTSMDIERSISLDKGDATYCRFVTAGNDEVVKVWKLEMSPKIRLTHLVTLRGHSSAVMCVALSESRIVSASYDRTLQVWRRSDYKADQALTHHSRYITSCAFSPDGSVLASCSCDKTINVYVAADSKVPSAPFQPEKVHVPDFLTRAGGKDNVNDKGIPEELICPITTDVMMDPVMAPDGYTYERQAIAAWMQKGQVPTSPLTGETFQSTNLVPNKNLKILIARYRSENPDKFTSQTF